MKFLFVITRDEHSPCHAAATALIRAVAARGHVVTGVFFTGRAAALCVPAAAGTAGSFGAAEYVLGLEDLQVPLLVCSRALSEAGATAAESPFIISGTTELMRLIGECERVVEF